MLVYIAKRLVFVIPVVFAVALGAMAAAPLLPAIVPAACRVSAAGASRRGLLITARRGWRDVRQIDDVPVGVLLSPLAKRPIGRHAVTESGHADVYRRSAW